jgi:hypothetical protein
MFNNAENVRLGLEWAHGTDPKCKQIIGGLLKPGEILALYRQARNALHTGDLVLVVTDEGPVVVSRLLDIENL